MKHVSEFLRDVMSEANKSRLRAIADQAEWNGTAQDFWEPFVFDTCGFCDGWGDIDGNVCEDCEGSGQVEIHPDTRYY